MAERSEQQLELIRDHIKSYEQMSISAISDDLHPDYVHVTRPESVNVPNRNKAQTIEYYGKMFDNWAKVATASYSFSRLPPPLSLSRSRPSGPSQILQGKFSFMFVSQAFKTMPCVRLFIDVLYRLPAL